MTFALGEIKVVNVVITWWKVNYCLCPTNSDSFDESLQPQEAPLVSVTPGPRDVSIKSSPLRVRVCAQKFDKTRKIGKLVLYRSSRNNPFICRAQSATSLCQLARSVLDDVGWMSQYFKSTLTETAYLRPEPRGASQLRKSNPGRCSARSASSI